MKVVARVMKIELRKAGISLKNFAKIIPINRNYFASLINNPIKWEDCTKNQRPIYHAMKAWIKYREHNDRSQSKDSNVAEIARKALKPINREEKPVNSSLSKKISKKQKR